MSPSDRNDGLPFSTVFLFGMEHSGTTLLGRMLAMSPDVIFPGELLRLDAALSKPNPSCFCGVSLHQCNYWRRVTAMLPAAVKTNYRKWRLTMLEDLRKSEGKRLMVDSSKNLAYRLLFRWRKADVGYILLVRDPRGVVRAAVRKNKALPSQLHKIRKWIGRYDRFTRRNSSRCLTVFYEDLASRPEMELPRVCTFLGLPFLPAMLHPDQKVHHLVHASRSPYLRGANRIEPDKRWREELTPGQLTEIARTLGKIELYERYALGEGIAAPAGR